MEQGKFTNPDTTWYRTQLYNRLKNTARQQEAIEEWENIKTAISNLQKKQFNYKKSLQRMNGRTKGVENPFNKRI